MKICYYIFLSMILVEKAQYNSCCFFCCCKKKQKLQCSGLTFLLFDVILFCFLRNKFWCFYHFLWAFWLKKKCTFHGNIYTNEKLNPFSDKICNFLCKKKKKKAIFQLITRGHIFPNFVLFWVQICINCTCLREN